MDKKNMEEVLVHLDTVSKVPPWGTVQVVSVVQISFRGNRFMVPFGISQMFDICNVMVGRNSLFASVGTIPAECFATRFEDMDKFDLLIGERGIVVVQNIPNSRDMAVGNKWNMPTAQPGMVIGATVHNTSESPARFRAAIMGTIS